MRNFYAKCLLSVLIVPLMLSGCKGRGTLDEDAAKFFESLDGPDVKGIEKSRLEQIEQAQKRDNHMLSAQLYKSLVDGYPEKAEYKLGLADSLRRAGQCNNAMPIYLEIIKKDASALDALEGKGFCQMQFGEAKEASRTFEAVLAKDKTRWRTLNATGILFASRGKVKEALAYFETAKHYSEGTTAVLNNLGIAQLLAKQYDPAITTFKQAARKLPSNSKDIERLDMNLSLAYALKGDMGGAAQYASKHLPEEAVYNNLGFFAKLKDDENLARDYLNMALTKSPTYYKRAWENLEEIKGSRIEQE